MLNSGVSDDSLGGTRRVFTTAFYDRRSPILPPGRIPIFRTFAFGLFERNREVTKRSNDNLIYSADVSKAMTRIVGESNRMRFDLAS